MPQGEDAATSNADPDATPSTSEDPEPVFEDFTAEEISQKWLEFHHGWIEQRWENLINEANRLKILPAKLNARLDPTLCKKHLKTLDASTVFGALILYLRDFHDMTVKEHKTPYPIAEFAQLQWRKRDASKGDSIWVLEALLEDPRSIYPYPPGTVHGKRWNYGFYMPPVPEYWRTHFELRQSRYVVERQAQQEQQEVETTQVQDDDDDDNGAMVGQSINENVPCTSEEKGKERER